ncbi:DMT family protein [Trinickia sp. LjRoot230]|uniref:DMT family protein n=1 Tax=Trinickia sp. LjRoot230 TaxID=3342288 RepID=UPI003ED10A6B
MDAARELSQSLDQLNQCVRFLQQELPPDIAAKLNLTTFASADEFAANADELLNVIRSFVVLGPAANDPTTTNINAHALADIDESERHRLMMRMIRSPKFQAIALTFIATFLKTAAWYGQTLPVFTDDNVLAFFGAAGLTGSAARTAVATMLKALSSWTVPALLEYIAVTSANNIADKSGDLSKVRAIGQTMDLAWFTVFLEFLKHEPLEAQNFAGLAVVVGGAIVANKPDSKLPRIDQILHELEPRDSKLSRMLAAVRNVTPGLKNADPRTSHIALREREKDARALVEHLNGEVCTQLQSLRDGIQGILSAPEALPPDVDVAELKRQLRRCDKLLKAIPKMSEQLGEVASDAENASAAKSEKMKKRFNTILWSTEALMAAATAIALKVDPAVSLVPVMIAATGLKNIAWYKHTTKTADEMRPKWLSFKQPKLQKIVDATSRVVFSWKWAFFEYVYLAIADRVAQDNHINLMTVRGPIEFVDLAWMATFMYMVKDQKLKWPQVTGLAMAGAGILIANL